ncbi:hypothetical protein EIN_044420 [Entamoeba invadens IP1]|uniref:Uncharacterized protein n=1 Tax=Entamoeba invadens IP1 TaxID=370355 RepID=A0A0A1TZA3_ENTIV|nr:hypothetical protein EIN_044420 [Entamoeba invadens IP1]ELP86884.1 hypothetical protein EIN_044420 [Entamoeba invadens IP1]|eukprot:XP_004253655.1 hypothetical protein EIN_044420 [Entamoeba invadens IP1]
MDLFAFMKTTLVLAPENKLLEGNYEKLFSSKTIEEFLVQFNQVVSKYLTDETIPFEERYSFVKKFTTLETPQSVRCVFDQVEENDKAKFQTAMLSIKELLEYPEMNEENKDVDKETRRKFKQFLNLRQKMIEQEDIPIDRLIDPFFIPEKKRKTNRKKVECLLNQLRTATQSQLQQIVKEMNNGEESDDLEIELSDLDNGTLDKMYDILN